ncbi:hypothetical protein [Planotetraspora sp. GP83]|uniref:hypothetical protein n=1 Tax=Planotetraspora sp. GP83 TaxID=3156264 RepID=UPI003516314A
MPQPVFDPTLSDDELLVLQENPESLHPASGLRPAARFGGRTGKDLLFCLWLAPLWTFVPGLIGFYFGKRGRVAGLVVQGALISLLVWKPAGLWLLTGGLPVVYGLLVSFCGDGRAGRLARQHHGRYVRPDDLDKASAALLQRAQTARATVLESAVNSEGLLDDVRNKVTLPQQEWEIAQTLAQISRLKGEQAAALAVRRNEQIAELLKPQVRALNLATESVTRRIEALEKYAAQVRAADEALAQWKTMRRLAASTDAYQELLARTVRDELAVVELAGLTEQARQVEEALRASVDKARRAGLVLVPGGLAEVG